MELTGKCAESFKEWSKGKGIENFNTKVYSLNLAKSIYNAILIDFFDSVGIFIFSDNLTNCIDGTKQGHPNMWQCFIKETYKNKKRVGLWFDDRNTAFFNGFKKANEIYNSRT